MLDFFRRVGFYTLDLLKGQEIRKNITLLKRCDQERFDSEFIRAHRERMISALLKHATATTAYYSEYNSDRFENFPVVNKEIIKENQDRFLSSSFNKENLVRMHTSGSTGTPFFVFQDRRKKKMVNAECIYYTEKLGYKLGNCLIYLRAIVKQMSKSRLKQFIQNQPLINCTDLSDTGIEKMWEVLSDTCRGRKYMIAYASTLDAFADYFRRCGNNIVMRSNISGIISGAEMLSDNTRSVIEEACGCPCISRYSNEENGILGQDDRFAGQESSVNNIFIINEASYYIEILKMDKDEPADRCEIGRVVVTDLYNYAMPMIRYDTGDIGAYDIVEYNGVPRRAITQFGGRRRDIIYCTNGNRISSAAISTALWSYQDVQQFQFIQRGVKEYTIKLNCREAFTREEDLIKHIRLLLGKDAEVTVEYVSEIPVLKSGKRQAVVNLMNNR